MSIFTAPGIASVFRYAQGLKIAFMLKLRTAVAISAKKQSLYFQTRYGKYIIRKYRPRGSRHDKNSGSNVSFREFVQYLINEGLDQNNSNEHWKPIFELCHPCRLNYTFIGRYEKFEEDSQILLQMIGAPSVQFPRTRSSGTSGILKYYYQQLSLTEIEKLYRLYEYDFKLFGYDLENILGYDIGQVVLINKMIIKHRCFFLICLIKHTGTLYE